MKKLLRMMVISLLVLIMVDSTFAKPIVFTGKPESIPTFICVMGVGVFKIINSRVDFEKEVIKRSEALGIKIEVPRNLKLFIPATKKSASQFLDGITAKKIEEGLVISSLHRKKEGLLRVFLGPRLVDTYGEDILGAKIYFQGSTNITTTRGGRINPAVEMTVGQQKIRMFIFKEHYELRVLDIVLSKEDAANSELKVPVTTEDIVMKISQYRVFETNLVNYSARIYDGADVVTGYEKISDKFFKFHMLVSDKRQGKAGFVSIDLTPDTLMIPKEFEMQFAEMDFSPKELVEISDLPANIPRIIINNSLTLASFVEEKKVNDRIKKELLEAKLDRTYRDAVRDAVIIAFLATILLFAIRVIVITVNRAKRRTQLKKSIELMDFEARCRLCGINMQLWNVVKKANEFAKSPKLNRSSKDAYGPTILQAENIIVDVWNQNEYLVELDNSLTEVSIFITKQTHEMRDALVEEEYDMAMLFKGRIEEAEDRRDAVQKAVNDLKDHLEKRKSAAKALFVALAKMNDRAEMLIDQVSSEGDLAEMGKEVQRIMEGVIVSFSEVSVDISAEAIEKVAKERRSAQIAGISAENIDELAEFVEKRES